MDSRELKKRILYEMASEYEEEYWKRRNAFRMYKGFNTKNDYYNFLARVYDLEPSDITEAKIKRFEKILQKIVDNFESKI